MVDCPTCNKEFSSGVGMKSHHKQSHNESIAEKSEYICEVCGTRFEGYDCNTNRFCSDECKYEWDSERMEGSGSPTWKDAIESAECDYCGECFERYSSQLKDYSNHYCSRDCKVSDQIGEMEGESNPAWKGGKIVNRRGGGWSRIAEMVVEEDEECLVCGISKDEYKEETERRLDVHHIVPRRKFDDADKANIPENLVSLCRECHMGVENGDVDCPNAPDRNL